MMYTLFNETELADLRARRLPNKPCVVTVEGFEGAVLYGAGRFSRAIIPWLLHKGIRPAWIVDNNPALYGQDLYGLEIKSRASLAEVGDRMVVIMTMHLGQMVRDCDRLGVKRWALFTDIAELFGNQSLIADPDELSDNDEIERVVSCLVHSPESLTVFRRALATRVTWDPSDYPACTPNQYFQDDWVPPHAYSHFVDCGAFNGDTYRQWLARLGSWFKTEQARYYGFEPDSKNFNDLQAEVEVTESKMGTRVASLYRCAVGNSHERLSLVPAAAGSAVYPGDCDGELVDVIPLDDVLSGQKVTAIKMDLEGFEMNALEGAKSILRQQRPVLLLAIYHRVQDLWRIPLWVDDLNLGYRLFMRHHDVTPSETVCYAVPAQD